MKPPLMTLRSLSVWTAALSVAVISTSAASDDSRTPLILRSEVGLPGRFTDLSAAPDGTWIAHFGAWSEYGGARPSALRLNGRWLRIPTGDAFRWKNWIVVDGLVPLGYRGLAENPTLPKGATYEVSIGTDDLFARRVVLIDRKTGRTFEAPWDTLGAVPLGQGKVWLLWRRGRSTLQDAGVLERNELLAWWPAQNRVEVIGELAGWRSFSLDPGVAPERANAFAHVTTDGGTRWIRVDSRGKALEIEGGRTPATLDGGSAPLVAFESVKDAGFDPSHPSAGLRTQDGREVWGFPAPDAVGSGPPGDGGPTPLTPSLGGGFALFGGFLFAEQGVFAWPEALPPPIAVSREGK